MKTGAHLAFVLALVAGVVAAPLASGPRPSNAAPGRPANAPTALLRRAVAFEPNVGQFEPAVRYRAAVAGHALSLTDAGAELTIETTPGVTRQVRLAPAGARRSRPAALDRLAGVVNHFEGRSPSSWHAAVPTFARVRYPAIYPGIDLIYRGSPDQIEYDFVVGRGADPSRIAVTFEGADRLEIDGAGDLLVHAGGAIVRQRVPDAWQEYGHERRRVDARFRIARDGTVAFAVGAYDRQRPLVIDPVLLYASYVNTFYTRVAIDGTGGLIVVTEQSRRGDGVSSGLALERFSPDGQTSIYRTLVGTVDTDIFFIGGLAATAAGEAIVVGGTFSPNLPLVNASQGYPGDTNSANGFVMKLTADGAFVFSTYLGGTGYDSANAVSVNRSGTIAVAGGTQSSDFPGVDGLVSGPAAGFVSLFSPAGTRLHGAILPEQITTAAMDDAGTVYVAGNTYLKTWPTTAGAFQPTPSQAICIDDSVGPCRQGVLARISADLKSLVYSTYLHETSAANAQTDVRVAALAVDAAGAAYILGSGVSFAATPGALHEQCPDWTCAFLTKLNPAGSYRIFSTFLPSFAGTLQVDAQGNIFLAGSTYFPNAPFAPTANAQQPHPASAPVFVTTDGGATWRPAPTPSDVSTVALAHTSGPLVYAGGESGLVRSGDFGEHWEPLDNDPWGPVFVAPSNSNIVYRPLGQVIRRSTDGGTTWVTVTPPVFVGAFAIDPVEPQTLYIGEDSAALFKSVDGGNTWTSANTGIPSTGTIQALAVAPSNRNLLVAEIYVPWPVERYDTYRSVDGAATWTRAVLDAGDFILGKSVFDPLDSTRVYATRLGGGLLRSADGGVTWIRISDCSCSVLAVTRTPDPTLFVASRDGLARVIDSGGPLPTPLPLSLGNGTVRQVAVDPVDPHVMAAVTSAFADGFLAVLDAGGTRVRYASYYGGTDEDSINAMALGPGGTVAISGWTYSHDLPLVQPQIPQRGNDLLDSYVAVMRVPLTTVVVDAPTGGSLLAPFTVAGWAIDASAPSGPGIDAVHVWAFPQGGGAPVFVGAASYGHPRPDVGSLFGSQFSDSGFSLDSGTLPPGSYTIAVMARSTVGGAYEAATQSVQIVGGGRMAIDTPVPGSALYQPFRISGWALDASAPTGTGIDAVHVWAFPDAGPPRFAGAATYGLPRPDVGDAFGSRFSASGFSLDASGLPPGGWTLAVAAHSSTTGAFDLLKTVHVTIPDGGAAAIDMPSPNSVVTAPFVIAGWALDRQGAGTGVDAVHAWAFPAGGGTPVFLGAAAPVQRPDVGAAFGDARFAGSGFALTVAGLAPGTYTVGVYAHSVATGTFSIVRLVQVTVQ